MSGVMKPTIEQSLYESYFAANEERLKELYQLIGDSLLVELIKPPEAKTASGIILAQGNKHQLNTLIENAPTFCRVLCVGEGFYNEDTGEDVPVSIARGDIILVSKVGLRLFSSFPYLPSCAPDTLGLTRESEVLWRFRGSKGFEEFTKTFDRAITEEVDRKKQG